jgi:hypothetical protein
MVRIGLGEGDVWLNYNQARKQRNHERAVASLPFKSDDACGLRCR